MEEKGPFRDIYLIIEATVPDENMRKILIHNLRYFQQQLKEAQHAH